MEENNREKVKLETIPHPLNLIGRSPVNWETTSPGSLTITAGKETDIYNYAGGGEAVTNVPMLLFRPDEEFILTVKVKVDFKVAFDAGSLLLYKDEMNWLKFLFEKGNNGEYLVGSAVTNTFTDDAIHGEVEGNEVYLRMAGIEKNVIILYSSTDGKNWKYIRLCRFDYSGALGVGFSAQSPQGESCRAQFSEITYSAKRFEDFWTGS